MVVVADSHGEMAGRDSVAKHSQDAMTRARASQTIPAVTRGRVRLQLGLRAKRERGVREQGLQASEHVGDNQPVIETGRIKEEMASVKNNEFDSRHRSYDVIEGHP